MKNTVPLRVDIPRALYEKLEELSKGMWGEKSRIVRMGVKIAIERVQREREAVKALYEEKESSR